MCASHTGFTMLDQADLRSDLELCAHNSIVLILPLSFSHTVTRIECDLIYICYIVYLVSWQLPIMNKT